MKSSMVKGLLLLGAAINLFSCDPVSQEFIIFNDSGSDWEQKELVISRSEMEKYFSGLEEKGFYILEDTEGGIVFFQADDLDGDDKWDECAAQINLKAGESITLLKESDIQMKVKVNTNIRFAEFTDSTKTEAIEVDKTERYYQNDHTVGMKYQMEGPAWENDKVGFRQYVDPRNGFDIYGKTTDQMALDGAGINGQNYHELDDWGLDILKVGNSLGAGGLALMLDDTLYRVGASGKGTVTVVAEGPVRSILDFDYSEWQVTNRVYKLKHRIIIWQGKYCYESHVTLFGVKGDENLVAGIVNKEVDTFHVETKKAHTFLATHGQQSLNNDMLGMAIVCKNKDFVSAFTTPNEGEGITETYAVKLNTVENKTIKFCFYACWELSDKQFATQKGFVDYLLKQIP